MAFESDPSPAFSVAKFYGSASGRKRKPQSHSARNKDYTKLIESQRKVPKPFPQRILGPSVCWKTFYRQQEAFDFADKTSEELSVFAFESSSHLDSTQGGQRRYLVSSRQQFWHDYSELHPSQKYHYEVIREGCRCKLYFDLEYMTEFNQGRDGDQMVDILIKYVCLWLKETFSIDCDRSDVLDMDASTANKFSRHLVFQLEQAVFDNCVVAGYFVRHIFTLLVQYLRLKTKNVSTVVPPSQWCDDQPLELHLSPSPGPKSPSAKRGGRDKTSLEKVYSRNSPAIDASSVCAKSNCQNQAFSSDIPRLSGKDTKTCKMGERAFSQYSSSFHVPTEERKRHSEKGVAQYDGTEKENTELKDVIKCFQESSDEEEISLLAAGFDRSFMWGSAFPCTMTADTGVQSDESEEQELSLLAERCEKEMEGAACTSDRTTGGFDDNEDNWADWELLNSVEMWEEKVLEKGAHDNLAVCSSIEEDFDDLEMAVHLDEYERESMCRETLKAGRETLRELSDCAASSGGVNTYAEKEICQDVFVHVDNNLEASIAKRETRAVFTRDKENHFVETTKASSETDRLVFTCANCNVKVLEPNKKTTRTVFACANCDLKPGKETARTVFTCADCDVERNKRTVQNVTFSDDCYDDEAFALLTQTCEELTQCRVSKHSCISAVSMSDNDSDTTGTAGDQTGTKRHLDGRGQIMSPDFQTKLPDLHESASDALSNKELNDALIDKELSCTLSDEELIQIGDDSGSDKLLSGTLSDKELIQVGNSTQRDRLNSNLSGKELNATLSNEDLIQVGDDALSDEELVELAELLERRETTTTNHCRDSPQKLDETNYAGSGEAVTVDDAMETICSHFSLEELGSLVVLSKDGGETTFCDLGVYTKNRNFRLYLSSKLNKSNPLLLSKHNQHRPPRARIKPPSSHEEDIFVASLVSVVNPRSNVRILQFGPSSSRPDLQWKPPPKCTEGQEDLLQSAEIKEPVTNGHSSSPFPRIDAFISILVSGDGRRGRVRMWRYSPDHESITYHITGYRWCSNIGREHRSNNIFYTVSLRDWTFTQGCYDVDCMHAQRKVELIPQSVLLSQGQSQQTAPR